MLQGKIQQKRRNRKRKREEEKYEKDRQVRRIYSESYELLYMEV